MKQVNIKWFRESLPEEDPFYRSIEGRFSIDPAYFGRTTPQGFYLRDNMKPENKCGGVDWGINELKKKANKIVEEELLKLI